MNFPIQNFSSLNTPFYYYDVECLRTTLQSIHQCIAGHSNFHVHYAVKANANPRILKLIAQSGLGADCVSGGEVTTAFDNGFGANQIVFAGVGKSDWEIREALKIGILCFNVESLPELEVISNLAQEMGKTAKIAFRVNPNVDAHTHAKITTGLNENKFGIDADDVLKAIIRCNELNGVEFIGLHFHIGSQILDLEVYRKLCLRINEIQKDLENNGVHCSIINVGGGLGIDYENPDSNPIADFSTYFSIFADNLLVKEEQEVHFELGRSVVGQCGSLVSRVLYVKEGQSKNFVIVDAGFTDLIRPAMYGAHHFTQNLSVKDETDYKLYDVVGPICESSDVFSIDEKLPETQRGDLIVFRSAGAYGEVMASTYNCRHLPQAYFSE